MCRLFGMIGHTADAAYFLTAASNNLRQLSRANPHGWGLGGFAGDSAIVARSGAAAHADNAFATQAWLGASPTLLGHVRNATVAIPDPRNSHPFTAANRLFAHNGAFDNLPEVERKLGPYRAQLHGSTDSERYFALLTRNIDRHGGDVEAALADTVGYLAEETPVLSLNMLLGTADDLYALRYPATNTLVWTEHAARDARRGQALLAERAIVVASEPLDDEHVWRALEPGQLLHVRRSDLQPQVRGLIERAPAISVDDSYRFEGRANARAGADLAQAREALSEADNRVSLSPPRTAQG